MRVIPNGRGAALLVLIAMAVVPGLALARPGVEGFALERVAFEHITMDRSVPADGEKLAGPVTEIRLFFSGAPLMRGASVRIANSARSLMRSSPPAPDATDPKQLFVTIDPSLPPGVYVVQWRCIADDGHVMRGDFTFEVTGA